MNASAPEGQDLLIAGEWRPAAAGGRFERVDPYTGEVATLAAAGRREDARAAVAAARDAFPSWSETTPAERSAVLVEAARLLDERAAEVAAAMTAEVGATFGWGMFNCALAAGMLRAAGAQAYATNGETIPSDVPGLTAMAVRAPAGVVVGMAPWNAPVILSARAIATPLAFGNTVVLKGGEKCPRVHAAIVAAIADAGAPAGVVNFVLHAAEDAPEVVDELCVNPAVRRVNFTGSTKVGRIIAVKCAENLKRCLLELGGKAPFVVLADADLEMATDAATFGAFMNSGQICMSTERIVVDRAVADDLLGRLEARAAALVTGDPRDQGTMVGPVVDAPARDHILELIADARDKGARILAGGDGAGNLLAPTIVADVTPEMRIYGEESFGPIVAAITVDGAEEAVRVANDSPYGLSAAVFGTDPDLAWSVAARIESGICHVNGATVHDEPQMPFGGVKDSGWGRFGGKAALEEFTELRWMTLQRGPRHYPI
ncbi:MAG: aldehyde dehydrogenase family protein [Solirubrobacterales bacterium]